MPVQAVKVLSGSVQTVDIYVQKRYIYTMKPIETIKDRRILRILQEVKTEIIKIYGVKLRNLVLYGSYARDEQDNESDIDIMILVEESEERLRRNRYLIADIMGELSMKHEKLVSLTQVPYNRYNKYLDVLPFYMNVDKDGVEVYGQKTA